jgi:hypothetical protein
VRPRHKEGETGRGADGFVARFRARLTAALVAAFDTAKAITAPVADCFSEFLELPAAHVDAVDPANPYWEFGSDADTADSTMPVANYPSLDL